MTPPSTAVSRLSVDLGARSYDILIGQGLLQNAGAHLAEVLARPRVAIVTDDIVAGLHLDTLTRSLADHGIAADPVIVPPGEGSKSMAELERLLDRLLDLKIERKDAIVALGGGVIGDLAGFAAAILRRGVEFIQIPTTLLAQVDSSVGGKTGINTRHGKNLIGAFHQPRLVLADVDVLATLPERELKAGYAEVVKYGLLGDFPFFEWLESHGPTLLRGDRQSLQYAVLNSCRIKADIVARDERESDVRALLNLGHTFAHAYEAEGGKAGLRHGEAVAAGMIQAMALSQLVGDCPAQDTERVKQHYQATGLPATRRQLDLAAVPSARLLEHMRQDKKVSDGRITFILVHGIGNAYISRDVTEDAVMAVLNADN
jgi:3-dehydroquinate synthase